MMRHDRFENRRESWNQDRGPRYDDDRTPPRDYDYGERHFFDRAADEVMSWFGNDEAEARRRFDAMMDRKFGRDAARGGYGGRSGINRFGYNDASPAPKGGLSNEMGFGYGSGTAASRQQVREQDEYAQDYEAWRNRQMAEHDRDYAEFRRERQKRFDNEFGQWKQKRYEQRLAVGTVKEHQEVLGSDGEHVGEVDYIRGDRIILTKSDKDAGGHHHSIPSRWIDRVDDKVYLNRTADQAQAEWRDIEARKAMFENDTSERDVRSAGYMRDYIG